MITCAEEIQIGKVQKWPFEDCSGITVNNLGCIALMIIIKRES